MSRLQIHSVFLFHAIVIAQIAVLSNINELT